jgi:aminopeptidase N
MIWTGQARALVSAFSRNDALFHTADGSGYAYIGEKIRELDQFNPQVAARMTNVFGRWKKYDGNRQQLMMVGATILFGFLPLGTQRAW